MNRILLPMTAAMVVASAGCVETGDAQAKSTQASAQQTEAIKTLTAELKSFNAAVTDVRTKQEEYQKQLAELRDGQDKLGERLGLLEQGGRHRVEKLTPEGNTLASAGPTPEADKRKETSTAVVPPATASPGPQACVPRAASVVDKPMPLPPTSAEVIHNPGPWVCPPPPVVTIIPCHPVLVRRGR